MNRIIITSQVYSAIRFVLHHRKVLYSVASECLGVENFVTSLFKKVNIVSFYFLKVYMSN